MVADSIVQRIPSTDRILRIDSHLSNRQRQHSASTAIFGSSLRIGVGVENTAITQVAVTVAPRCFVDLV